MKKEIIKSFSIDFNWLNGKYSPSDTFCNANAKEWAKWYKDLGCNNFWTFAVSYNGYAWYDSKLSPKIKGLNDNFTKDCVIEGHKLGMSVYAYHCLAANPVIEEKYPQWSRKNPDDFFNLIFCDEYVDLFCKMIKESIFECDYDGLVIDWFRCPAKRLPTWEQTEIDLYNQLMDNPFMSVEKAEKDEFEKRSIENAWRKIKNAVMSVKNIPIWTNQPFEKIDDPVWNGNLLMKDVDFLLNEGPDFDLLEWIKKESGEKTAVVQNLCGWASHDLTFLDKIKEGGYGMFGFAAADPNTCLPFEKTDDALKQVDAKQVLENHEFCNWTAALVEANRKNIKIIKKEFNK